MAEKFLRNITTTIPRGWTPLSAGEIRDVYAPDEAVVGSAPQTATQADRLCHVKAGPEAFLMMISGCTSAYDYVLSTLVSGKGVVLNQLAIWWMGQLRPLVKNHPLAVGTKALAEASHTLEGAQSTHFTVPTEADGHTIACRSLHVIPVEYVVRGYLTGSDLIEYRESGPVCGIKLPEGLTEASRLEEPVFTPVAKTELSEHDENITFGQTIERIDEELVVAIRDLSISLYRAACDIAAEHGIIIADTKSEFGIDVTTGVLVLANEILTPGSPRFWPID